MSFVSRFVETISPEPYKIPQRGRVATRNLSFSSRRGRTLSKDSIRTFIQDHLGPDYGIRDFVRSTRSQQNVRDELFKLALEEPSKNRDVLEFFAKNKLVSEEFIAQIPQHRHGGSRPRSVHSKRAS